MILLTPLALTGLVLLPLLIVLHLRLRRYRLEEVSSTRLWRELLDETRPKPSGRSSLLPPSAGMRLHSLPLLLLQLLAVALLVVGLARPASLAAPLQRHRQHVYILDDSLRMAATDLRPNRLALARQIIGRQIDAE